MKRRFCRCLLTAILLTAGVFTHAAVQEPGTPEFVAPAHNQKIVAVAQAAGEVESLPEVRSKVFAPWGCGQ